MEKTAKVRWVKEIQKLSPMARKRLSESLSGHSRFIKILGMGGEGVTELRFIPRLGLTVKKRYFPLSKYIKGVTEKQKAYEALSPHLKKMVAKRYKYKYSIVPTELSEFIKGKSIDARMIPPLRMRYVKGKGYRRMPPQFKGPHSEILRKVLRKVEGKLGDVGPHNILMSSSGQPKIIDFLAPRQKIGYKRLTSSSQNIVRSILLNTPKEKINPILSRWEATGKFPRKMMAQLAKRMGYSGEVAKQIQAVSF
jgi:hypothetical protein